jgi:N-formylmaleamate deformylase
LQQLADLDLLSSWPRIQAPLHLLYGAEDPLSPASLLSQVETHLLPGSTLSVLPQAGHLAHFDRPQEVRMRIKRALYSPG